MGFDYEGYKQGEKTPFDHLFKDLRKLSRAENDGGLKLVGTVENGNVLLDFGEPVQALGMSQDEVKALIMMLVEATFVAEVKGSVKKSETH